MRPCKPATRSAEGPMSTPRRLAPKSMGTPIIRIFCAIAVLSESGSQRRTGVRGPTTDPPQLEPAWFSFSVRPRVQTTRRVYLLPKLRIYPVNHPGEGDDLSDMLRSAYPGHRSLQPHAEAGVGHASVPPQ